MVCHVHNPDGAYAEQHPTFRARLVAQLDALITGPSPASHTTVRDLEKLAARYISAEKLAVAYRKARDAAIAELATSGVPGDVLAAAAGLTQPRVVQITNAAHGLGRNRRR